MDLRVVMDLNKHNRPQVTENTQWTSLLIHQRTSLV